MKAFVVYASNCKNQQKLYQKQLFYSSSVETETLLFICFLIIFFIHLGYTYLFKKNYFSTHNSKQCKVSIAPNWHPVGKITILLCGKTAHYAVSTITPVSKVLFEILHIESVSMHMHLSSLV